MVLDTNILISSYFWRGNPWKIYSLCLEKKVELFLSPSLVVEFKKSVLRDFGILEERLLAKIEELLSIATLIIPSEKVFAISNDPDDNKVLEAALEAKADFIVSGDKHLLELKEFKGIRIVSSKEFLLFQNL